METEVIFPQTLTEAIVYFADSDNALQFFVTLRWPDGVTCPYCKGRNHSFIKTRRIWQCKDCKKQFSAKVGTIFEDSPLGLDKWLSAIWLIGGAKNGISSHEVHRALGVTQKTAWFMMHRIRLAMTTQTFEKLSGDVEVDEAAIGGTEKFKHLDKRLNVGGGTGGKAIVMGLIQRNGDVRTKHIKAITQATLKEEVRANVEPGSDIHTDTWPGYKGLDMDYGHQTVNHRIGQYVKGNASTNHIENYWSVLKRAIKGSYIHVSDEHLQRYLAEEDFRYNNRGMNDGGRFAVAVAQAPGRRLTYKALTRKGE